MSEFGDDDGASISIVEGIFVGRRRSIALTGCGQAFESGDLDRVGNLPLAEQRQCCGCGLLGFGYAVQSRQRTRFNAHSQYPWGFTPTKIACTLQCGRQLLQPSDDLNPWEKDS